MLHQTRKLALLVTAILLNAMSVSAQAPEFAGGRPVIARAATLKHATAVFVVDAVEPSVAFWVDRFGFTAENRVLGPDGKLMFASVKRGDVEIMYQTKASVLAENPSSAAELSGHTAVLFITVDDINSAELAVKGAPVVEARHKTPYGSIELYVREPGGNTVGFAQFP